LVNRPLTGAALLNAAIVAVFLSDCSDGNTGPAHSGYPAELQIVAGDAQSAIVGTELLNALVVRVVDSAQVPVKGQLVNFRVTSGGGSVFAGASITNDSGTARERWTLGTSTADSQRLEARAVDNNTGAPIVFAVFQATALPGAAVQLLKVSGDSQRAAGGSPLPDSLAARVADRYGNGVSGHRVTWSPDSGSGLSSPNTATTNAEGIAKTQWTLDTKVGHQGLAATADTFAPIRFLATAGAGPAVQIGAGSIHTCALSLAGQAFCWGNNSYGQLGDSTLVDRKTSVLVAGGHIFTKLSVGGYHTCALTNAGEAYCWGEGSQGELGDSMSTFNNPSPVAVAGGLTFVAISAGYFHTCGLTSGGAAYCWGENSSGELGTDTTISETTPTAVAGGLSFAAIAASARTTCGVTAAKVAYCWGANDYRQLGDTASADSIRSLVPVPVAGGIPFASVAPDGLHTCGLSAAGEAYCWGLNANASLGNGSFVEDTQPTPGLVVGGLTFVQLAAECGLASSGQAYCWGSNNTGQLGDGTTMDRASPVPVSGALSFSAITAGGGHTCAVTGGGGVYCWGYNNYGEIGDGTTIQRLAPTAVPFGP
jgi:alpha-tubulin suppressor-like RCC1 family protein